MKVRFSRFVLGLFLLAWPGMGFGAEILFEELVTVGIDHFSLGWSTSEPVLSEIVYGLDPDHPDQRILGDTQTKDHYILVEGLAPDTEYYYSVLVDGNPQEVDGFHSPGVVRTLAEPPGAFLFSFATINDTHIGEAIAGLVVIGDLVLTPGFTWDDPENPYWLFTNRQAVQQINEAGVDFTIHKGDVTADASHDQYLDAMEIFGELEEPIYYVRGNHDRAQHDEDYFVEDLGIESTYYFFDYEGICFIVMDSNDGQGSGDVSDGQISWLEQTMKEAAEKGNRTMIFAHHTFARQGAPVWAVSRPDAEAIADILIRHPKFDGMFAGHSHRAKVLPDADLGDVPFVETPATKEYPMGYSIYRVYEGGYSQSFYRTTCPECLEWSRMTRKEYFGLAPVILMGSAKDRNFTYCYPDWSDGDDDDNDAADADDDDDDDMTGEEDDDEGGEDENAGGDDDSGGGCCG